MSKENTAVTKKKIKRCKEDVVFDAACFIILTLVLFVVAYPLYWVIISSISAPSAVSSGKVLLHPIGFTLKGYAEVFKNDQVMRGFLNSLIITFCGVMVNLIVTLPTSYALSRSNFSGKKPITIFYLITMFFGGGMIPTYLTIRNLHMIDTLWAMILPGAISAWNVIMFVNFFKEIPASLRESATIDGAGHVRILFAIVIPLSKALLATIALFTIVGFWNDYFNAMLYLDSTTKMPIQIFLRKILVNMEINRGNTQDTDMSRLLDMINANPRTVKAAATIIPIIPILCVYPFLQKYFTKGMMLGAVKA